MGRVDDRADALAGEKRGETFGAAEAADPLRNWRPSGIGGRAGKRQDGGDIGFAGDPRGQRARLRRTAENEQAKAVQKAAP